MRYGLILLLAFAAFAFVDAMKMDRSISEDRLDCLTICAMAGFGCTCPEGNNGSPVFYARDDLNADRSISEDRMDCLTICAIAGFGCTCPEGNNGSPVFYARDDLNAVSAFAHDNEVSSSWTSCILFFRTPE